jgi:hypothetical protein
MKEYYVNFRFEYKGLGVHESWCVVQVYTHKKRCVAILTEPGVPDTGTSVTNACETIATMLYNEKGVFPKGTKPEDIIWCETYARSYREMEKSNGEVDRISFDFKNGEYKNPQWSRIFTSLSVDRMFFLEKIKELIKNSDV